MLKKYFYFLLLLILPTLVRSESYPEVLFDNSVINGSYAKSIAHYTGESWIQNVSYSLPVSDSLFLRQAIRFLCGTFLLLMVNGRQVF
jgi:hypothetical protein